MAEQIKVELYTQSTCPWSRNARAWLDNHHVPYEFVDYDLADEGLQRHIQEEMVAPRRVGVPVRQDRRRRLHHRLQPGRVRAPAGSAQGRRPAGRRRAARCDAGFEPGADA